MIRITPHNKGIKTWWNKCQWTEIKITAPITSKTSFKSNFLNFCRVEFHGITWETGKVSKYTHANLRPQETFLTVELMRVNGSRQHGDADTRGINDITRNIDVLSHQKIDIGKLSISIFWRWCAEVVWNYLFSEEINFKEFLLIRLFSHSYRFFWWLSTIQFSSSP